MHIFKATKQLTLLLAILFAKQGLAISPQNPITYDDNTLGCYIKDEYRADWCDYPSSASGAKEDDCRQSMVKDPSDSQNTSMELTLPKDTIGGSDGGMAVVVDVKNGSSDTVACSDEPRVQWSLIKLEYDVMFVGSAQSAVRNKRASGGEDFYWGKGGKLPGITTYPESPSGCVSVKNGGTERLMWREDGKLYLYSYSADKEEDCGDYYALDTDLMESDRWYHITIEATMNDLGKANGSVNVSVDNNLAYELTGVLFAKDEATYWDQLHMDCFRGGGDDSWAAPVDSYVAFDNFVVSGTSASSLLTKKAKKAQTKAGPNRNKKKPAKRKR
jgi:hypothetical protein